MGSFAEGDVEVLTVPGFLAFGARGLAGFDLGFLGIDQPGAGEEFAVAVFEVAEESGVDGYVVVVGQVIDNAFGGMVEFSGDDN